MGCVSSKRVEAAVVADVYRPPPASVAVFDINAIEEPWLVTVAAADSGAVAQPDQEKKLAHVRLPILDKLDSFELAPHSWSEVSKALEDLKPSLQNPPAALGKASPAPPLAAVPLPQGEKQGPPPRTAPEKNHSFHTLEELEAKLNSDKKSKPKAPSPSSPPPPALAAGTRSSPPSLPEGLKPVSQNKFVLRDREEREKNSANPEDPSRRWRRNPLDGLPELCPPGGADGVVLYTTTLRGVRRTFEDCERARQLVEAHCADVDERDVSLHGEYLKELKELVGEGAGVPRLFVKGRYVGGVNEVVEFNETGRLRLMMRLVRGAGEDGSGGKSRRGCGGCGGARFVPCTECSGSCKVVADDGKGTARCGWCNENGLVQCPRCH